MPKLVALLVGINAYQPPISKLKGCVNDVAKMATYLHSLTAHFEAIDILTLTDEQADKTNLVTQFQDHLSKAQTDDVALFYYAGHGAQEHADLALWPHESDGRLECLVCHDNQLLADKELRWLFAHLSQNSAHIVSIFDCCHAGDNVRASVPTDKSVTVRQALPTDRSIRAFPKREWADFIFHREIDPDELVEKGIASIFPDENFIQLAACSNTQLAAEVSDGGVFTSALLQFLTSSTKILAYYDLSQRVSKLISHEFDQTPQAYVASSHQGHEAIFRGFLNLPADQKSSFYGNVTYLPPKSDSAAAWSVDIGTMHGINPEKEQTFLLISADGKERYDAIVDTADIHSSLLQITSAEKPNPSRMYYAYSDAILRSPILVKLTNEFASEQAEETVKNVLKAYKNISLTDSLSSADFHFILDQSFRLTAAQTGKELANAIRLTSSSFEKDLNHYLSHLSNWMFVKSLTNPDEFFSQEQPIAIRFWMVNQNGEEHPCEIKHGEVHIHLDYPKQKKGFKVKVSNVYDQTVHVAALCLGADFSISTRLFKGQIATLAPGNSEFFNEGEPITMGLKRYVLRERWESEAFYLKFIVSTSDQLAIDLFRQKKLPAPQGRGSLDANKRAMLTDEDDIFTQNHEWMTSLIKVVIHNPAYRG